MQERRLDHDWFSRPLPSNVQFGGGSFLYSSFAFLHYASKAPVGVMVGRHTGVYHGTFFDLGPEGEINIGDYCSVVGAIFATNGKVSIDNYSFLAHEVVIADTHWALPGCGNDPSAARSPPGRAAVVDVGANVWIGAQAMLIGSLRIGEGAIIGAAAVITEDVPPFTVWGGNPARLIRKLAPK
jgi:acetyltransferase-like isoleucine patch superfamily enzyme